MAGIKKQVNIKKALQDGQNTYDLRQKTKYLAGNQLYYCDIAVFDSIEACLDLPCFNREKELKPFPILEQWYVEMGNIPHLKSYLEERGGRMEYVLKYLSKKK